MKVVGIFRQFLSDASDLLLLGVGISGLRRVERSFDLSLIVTGDSWKLSNLQAEMVEHRAEPAVHLTCGGEPGLAWVDGFHFTEGEIRIDWAASQGSFGIAIDVQSEKEYRLIRFSSGGAGNPAWRVQLLSSGELRAGDKPDQPVEELNGIALDWVRVKISVQKGRLVVIVNDNNIPCLRGADFRIEPPGGSIGLWVDRMSSALFTRMKCVEIRKQVKI